VFAGLSLLATPPSTTWDSLAGPVAVSIPQAGCAVVPSDVATAQHRGDCLSARSATDRGNAITASCDCAQHGLLIVTDYGGRLHLLCPACGAVAWSGAALASLPGAPAQLRGGSASEHAEVVGAGNQAMSSAPCLVHGACTEQTEEVDTSRRNDRVQQEMRLVWCTSGGIVGMSALTWRRPKLSGSTSFHRPPQSVSTRPPADISGLHYRTADRVQEVEQTASDPQSEQLCTPQQHIVPAPIHVAPAELRHVHYNLNGAVQLLSDTFAAPVAFGRFVVVGCRDDHLYCLEWS